ncbi:archaellin/type IV pilin N-terminal domain-containing protein [Halorubrum ezzemoulense]|uniref:archaellin/type IV pilin N-terminal domain-containing protein n=1 Tax=Halorubrum ezzemoulense TaxID=337243 RepID=UPI00232BECE8|nr:archaellin/type IV pilin N-terminal domain-containing protein [Halorubrum ezzemoulense]MDB9251786.1 flagellin [Halorubrum ezzemoulense]MDB9256195.1 flagellin [Halorubrum ezzemoulense]MDB9276906.1 flagellin [Halorubrum ezzemoulense]
MFETILDEEERGQVGIGTLIVFIAMVLVAAIAAGVLINTAGFLQTQAEATGEESTAQVSERIQVISQSGVVADDAAGSGEKGIGSLEFVVASAPGAGNVDLDEVTAELVGADGQKTFQLQDNPPVTDVSIFTGTTTDNVLTDNSDRAEVSVDLEALSDPYELTEGDSLTVTFTTASGASTTTEIRVPTTLVGDNGDSVRL